MQLVVLFALGLLATVGTGAFGVLASLGLTREISDVLSTDMPRARAAAEASERLSQFELASMVYLAQPLHDPEAEARIRSLAAGLGEAGTGPISETEAGTDQDPSPDARPLGAVTQDALAAHSAAARFQTVVDGAVIKVPAFLAIVAREQEEYLTLVGSKGVKGQTRGIATDPTQTRFALWAQKFDTDNPDIAALITRYGKQEALMVNKVAEDIASLGKVDPKTAARLQRSAKMRLNIALNNLIKEATARVDALETTRNAAISDLQQALTQHAIEAREAHGSALDALVDVVGTTRRHANDAMINIGGALAASVLITLGACLYAWSALGRPLGRLIKVIATLADRDYTLQVPFLHRVDDIGAIARAAETLRDTGQSHEADMRAIEAQRRAEHAAALSALATSLHRLSEGDLTCAIRDPLGDDYEALRSDFNTAQMALHRAVVQISESSATVNRTVGDISSATEDLSRRTESSASALLQTSETLNALTKLLEGAAASAAEADQMASSASARAEAGTAVLNETVAAMQDLDQSSGQIMSIVDVVDDIAFQTNLLALNAGVEAARAGTAGKGFSVVAAEVQALALRSSEAAREIGTLLRDSGQRMSRGVALVDRVGQSLSEIAVAVEGVSGHISGIAEATRNQSDGLREISGAVGQLEQTIQQNAAMFEQTSAATRTLSTESQSLTRATSAFQTSGQTTGHPMGQSTDDSTGQSTGQTTDDASAAA